MQKNVPTSVQVYIYVYTFMEVVVKWTFSGSYSLINVQVESLLSMRRGHHSAVNFVPPNEYCTPYHIQSCLLDSVREFMMLRSCCSVFTCIPLPSNQILISKYQASGGVVVSVGWGNVSGWQWNTK